MFREPSVAAHYREAPQLQGDGWRCWITRAANFAVVYSQGEAGAEISGRFVDEHCAYALQGDVTVSGGGTQAALAAEDLAILPPGEWTARFGRTATLVQVVTAEEMLVQLAANAAAYAGGASEVAPVVPLPEPAGGYRLRTYSTLAGYARGGMVHAYRTRKLMIVPYARFLEPRDETQLTPHSHADFEQGSLALEGQWQHHLRVPWTANRRHWKPDRTVEVGSPSMLVIPAGVIHTSQGVAGEGMRLVDIFAPPRRDFAERGQVDNAQDYPLDA